MNNLTFVLSDEGVNSFGFIVRTNGIDLERFKKNPVMLHMHERESGVIGRWDNIRIEGVQLLADAVFDENDPIGAMVKRKVEGGFIRSVSIGIADVVKETVNDIETVKSCVLEEVSIVDIPSNQNAVKLRKKGGKCVLSLQELDDTEGNDLRAELLELLGLDEETDTDGILMAIKELLKGSQTVPNEVQNALRLGLIDKAQERTVLAMRKYDPKGFDGFMTERKNFLAADVVKLVNKAIDNARIIHYERTVYEDIGNNLGIATLRKLLNTLPQKMKPMDVISGGGARSSWSLDDYRKFAPEELAANPALYNSLLKRKSPENDAFTLDWYRRNNPDFLLQNPEIYERLLAKENNTNN